MRRLFLAGAVAMFVATVPGVMASAVMPTFVVQLRATAEPPPQLIGTWRLVIAKSKYSPGPPPRSETRVYRREPDGVHGVVTRVLADGKTEKFEYTANFGQDIVVTGIADYDRVTLRKVDELTSDAVLSHAGNVYGVARRAVAQDGRAMTITFDRKNNDLRIHNVAVYEKVAE